MMFEEDYSEELEILRENGCLPDNFQIRRSSVNTTGTEKHELLLLADGEGGPSAQTSVEAIEKKSELSKRLTLKVPALGADGLPIHWTKGLNKNNTVFTLIELRSGNEEFDTIEADLVGAGVNVQNIERLQSVRHLERFKNEIKDVTDHRTNGYEANVSYLYHGTKVKKERLCEEGLDQRLSRMGHFGKGIYFSDNPTKCVQYCQPDQEGSASILLCRVLLGDTKIYPNGEYDTTLRREPERENALHGCRYYDSVMKMTFSYVLKGATRTSWVKYQNLNMAADRQQKHILRDWYKAIGCPIDHNEYVVYENRRAMIEYIITFSVNNTRPPSQTGTTTSQAARRPSLTSADIPISEESNQAAGAAPEALVLSLCVSEFLQITGEEDSSVARQYLQMANSDLSQAVSFYYENI